MSAVKLSELPAIIKALNATFSTACSETQRAAVHDPLRSAEPKTF